MNKALKYILRSIKYFLYCTVILVVILYVLSLANMVEWDVNEMFNEGMKSVAKIAAMLAVISAVYPMVGFQKRKALISGSWAERKDEIIAVMEDKGYSVAEQYENGASFRSRSIITRLTRMTEDKIMITEDFGGFEFEGLRKDVVRLVMHMEYRLNS